MKFVENANLPDSPACLVLADARLDEDIKAGFSKLGIKALYVGGNARLHEVVSAHPDMSFCHVGSKDVVYAPGTCNEIIRELSNSGFNTVRGTTRLTAKYPGDIAYNVAIIGGFAFHNFRYTDPLLKEMIAAKGIDMIDVRQGYSKCSVCITGRKSMITSDAGIAEEASNAGISVLYAGPQHDILLPGFDYGFIGGATGLIDRNILAFTGDVKRLGSYHDIKEYLLKNGIEPLCLSKDKVVDSGSILPLMTI